MDYIASIDWLSDPFPWYDERPEPRRETNPRNRVHATLGFLGLQPLVLSLPLLFSTIIIRADLAATDLQSVRNMAGVCGLKKLAHHSPFMIICVIQRQHLLDVTRNLRLEKVTSISH